MPNMEPSESGRGGKEKEPREAGAKWPESVDFAYEYVPVVQRREGRKNM
jgi:hypothetical protein